ncbi:ATP-binding protein [Streptomyces sp. NPDC088812]|uniref:ATP-binding protein n=1 Tax=Streptomyces sp. NPDC088812 TaxID=3365905 RepID=UPI00382F7CA7
MRRSSTCPVVRTDGSLRGLRGHVRAQLRAWRQEALADDAEIVVGELVTNALRHGRPPVRVSLSLRHQPGVRNTVRIEVTDAGAAFDVRLVRARWRHPSFTAGESGRGLLMVDALTCGWGDLGSFHGHTVWAELVCEGAGVPVW